MLALLLSLLLCTLPAHADDVPDGWKRVGPPAAEGAADPPADSLPRHRQPPEPKALVDHTAHTLGRGRVRLGLVTQAWGVLDNVDLQTRSALFLVGVPNLSTKITAIQTRPLDLALRGGGWFVDLSRVDTAGDLKLRLLPVGWTGSLTLSDRVSIHLGTTWDILHAEGAFTVEELATGLATTTGTDLDPLVLDVVSEIDGEGELVAAADLVLTRHQLCGELRLNRRDSLILALDAATALRGTLRAGYRVEAAESGGTTAEIGTAARLDVPLQDAVSALGSLSWQFSWEHTHLRLGIPLPLGGNTWLALPQAISLHWVLGGKHTAAPADGSA